MNTENIFLVTKNILLEEGNDHHVLEIGELLLALKFMTPGYTGVYKSYKILTKFGIGFIFETELINRAQKLS
jgi:hypothetical protein